MSQQAPIARLKLLQIVGQRVLVVCNRDENTVQVILDMPQAPFHIELTKEEIRLRGRGRRQRVHSRAKIHDSGQNVHRTRRWPARVDAGRSVEQVSVGGRLSQRARGKDGVGGGGNAASVVVRRCLIEDWSRNSKIELSDLSDPTECSDIDTRDTCHAFTGLRNSGNGV